MTITLQNIADKLNISKSTASKALKGYPDVNTDTRNKVIALANELDYSPNTEAINLRLNQSKIIGVIIPTIVHNFFAKVIEGVIEEAEQKGYFVITLQSNEKSENEDKYIELLLSKRVDGILISLSNESYKFKYLNKAISNEIPVVMFDKISKIVNCSKVTIDDEKAAYEAVSFLIRKGYRRIAHLRASLIPQISIDRFKGYKRALAVNDIPFDPSIVFICDSNDDFDDGHKYAKKILEEGVDVDAIFAVTDLLAIGALNYFNKNNIKIPENIAIFGFSNWFMSEVVTPSISTVEQPNVEMGRKAAEILINEIDAKHKNKKIEHQHVVLPTSLIIRDSTKK